MRDCDWMLSHVEKAIASDDLMVDRDALDELQRKLVGIFVEVLVSTQNYRAGLALCKYLVTSCASLQRSASSLWSLRVPLCEIGRGGPPFILAAKDTLKIMTVLVELTAGLRGLSQV